MRTFREFHHKIHGTLSNCNHFKRGFFTVENNLPSHLYYYPNSKDNTYEINAYI